MNANSLLGLVRHAYRDGTFAYNYSTVTLTGNDAWVSRDFSASTSDPADRFTFWPPQPMTPWFDANGHQKAPAK